MERMITLKIINNLNSNKNELPSFLNFKLEIGYNHNVFMYNIATKVTYKKYNAIRDGALICSAILYQNFFGN